MQELVVNLGQFNLVASDVLRILKNASLERCRPWSGVSGLALDYQPGAPTQGSVWQVWSDCGL
jgi:hypothetical protein